MGASGAGGAAAGSDSDSDGSIDWDKTMHEEIIESSLDNRRRFLTRFLHIKLVQLKDTEKAKRLLAASRRKTSVNKPFKKVRFKDQGHSKYFWVKAGEEEDETSGSDAEIVENMSDLAMVTSGNKFKGKPKDNRNKLGLSCAKLSTAEAS